MNIEIAKSLLVATGGSLTVGWGVAPYVLLAYRAVYESKNCNAGLKYKECSPMVFMENMKL
jgi:hypothetical protein